MSTFAMANQDPGSSSLGDNVVVVQPEKNLNAFSYEPLDPSKDSLRILILEPNLDPKAALQCRLFEMPFGEKPRYEALSYTWGSEGDMKKIFISGKDFHVRRNLWDALVYLRETKSERSIWIDAICINQANILERNGQVRIMHHIYGRAQAVLVWLGTVDLDKGIWDMTFNDFGFYDDHDKNSCETLIEDMCNRDYWNRVWIIQEISKARKIWIHYGTGILGWDTFINNVKNKKSLAKCIPLILAKQLSQRFSGGHSLENLLKLHEKALCKEPRDKIYGFAGLAIDCCSRLPVDYGKTLFEVWKDVVLFKNSNRDAPQRDILRFARLVKSMLGGSEIATAAELKTERDLHRCQTLDIGDSDVLMARVLLRGKIIHLGPTYEALFSDLQKEDEWQIALTELTPQHRSSDTYEENESFRRLLDELGHEDLKRIHNFDRDMSFAYSMKCLNPWRGDTGEDFSYARRRVQEPRMRNLVPSGTSLNLMVEEIPTLTVTSQTRLFFLETDYGGKQHSASYLGLAPGAARAGDFVCHLYGTDQAVIIREGANEMYTLVGVGVVAKDLQTVQSTSQGGVSHAFKFAVPLVEECGIDDIVELHMDLALAYELSI